MKFFVSIIILLIICQYFINQIIVDARPAKSKKFSWTFPIHENEHDDEVQELVKRKPGAGKFYFSFSSSFKIIDFILLLGWGKRNALLLDDHPYAVHENSARIWFDDK